jgi:hypothetical protein
MIVPVTSVTPTKSHDIVWMHGGQTLIPDNTRVMQSPERRLPFTQLWEMKLMRPGLTTAQSRRWLPPLRSSPLTRYTGIGTPQSGSARQ